jgi:hypothetical protein
MALYDRMNQNRGNALRMAFATQNPQAFLEANPGLGGPDFSPNNAYAQSIPQQAGDYDEIMQGYRNMLSPGDDGGYGDVISRYQSELNRNGGEFSPASYTEAPEFQEAYRKLNELAATGGLSEADQGNLRARAISPIRSVYANMTRNMDRQKRLGGGFSPNYNAAATRMARESSEQIGETTTNANAAIAEMVQKGKLAAAPELARFIAGKNEMMNQIALANSANKLKAGDMRGSILAGYGNAVSAADERRANALRGMTSLYGTNPALVETFGRQVQGQQQISNQNNQARSQNRTRRALGAAG